MDIKNENPNKKDWAEAIATRIADEYGSEDINGCISADRKLLERVLTKAFMEAKPETLSELIGTSIIESDYFDEAFGNSQPP